MCDRIEFPDVLFVMYIEDCFGFTAYKDYFLNGKTHETEAEIIFPEFDASKLR